jgi:hypothetical protein
MSIPVFTPQSTKLATLSNSYVYRMQRQNIQGAAQHFRTRSVAHVRTPRTVRTVTYASHTYVISNKKKVIFLAGNRSSKKKTVVVTFFDTFLKDECILPTQCVTDPFFWCRFKFSADHHKYRR